MKNVYKLRGNSLEVYAALYSLTKKTSWTGTMTTLAGYMDVQLDTLKRACKLLENKGLLSIENIAYSTYSFQALHPKKTEIETVAAELKKGKQAVTQNEQAVTQNEQVVTQNEQDLKERSKENINNILNKKENNVCVAKPHTDAQSATHTQSVEKNLFIAPQWEEIYQYAKERLISIEVAKNFYAHYSTTGWKLGRGGKIYDWHALLYKFDVKAREIAKEQSARAATRYQAGNQITREQAAERARQLEAERVAREQADAEYEASKNDAEAQAEIAAIQERLRRIVAASG